jgi:hypothetical protein
LTITSLGNVDESRLVRALTDAMGVEYTPVGKQVWFRVARSPGLLDPQSG